MALRLTKPWRELTSEEVRSVSGQLGVYELANDQGEVIYIGNAGGRSLFGLRGELTARIGQASQFRIEINTAYRTRHRELLMVHKADHDAYPINNTEAEVRGLGTLSVAGGNS